MIRNTAYYVMAVVVLVLVGCDQDVTQPNGLPTVTPSFSLVSDLCSGPATAKGAPQQWPYLYGTPENDKLIADATYSIQVYGRAGNDCLIGGDHRNSLFGEEGDDILQGGRERDYLDGGSGNDVIFGGAGDDFINVGDGESDTVDAGAGNDVIYAVDGAVDEIDCGKGTDTAYVDEIDVVRNCENVRPRPW